MTTTASGGQTDHIHPRPDYVATLPPPTQDIGAQARDHVHFLLTAADADCDRCIYARLEQLIAAQRESTPQPAVKQDGPVRSMNLGGQPAAAGPAEAVYADLLHLLAQLLVVAADKAGAEPVSFADQAGQDFIAARGPLHTGHVLVSTAASLIGQGCDPQLALDLALGTIPMFNMMMGDGHRHLTVMIDTAVGLVAAVAETNTEP